MPLSSELPDINREGLSVSEACRVAGLGRTKMYEAIADGRLKARKFGKRTLILRADLQSFLLSLPVVGADA
jgi:excisionase family DNA binding protein